MKGVALAVILGLIALGLQAHAQAPTRIDSTDVLAMDAAALSRVSELDLCDAYASQRRRNLDGYPAVPTEVRRRSANCTASMRSIVGDCEPLRLVKTEPVPGRGTAYYVQNSSNSIIRFRINHRGVSSTMFEIEPQAEKGFGVEVDMLTAGLGRHINRENLSSKSVEFYDCSEGLGGFPPDQTVMARLHFSHRLPDFYPVRQIKDMFGSVSAQRPKEWRVRLTQGVRYQIVGACNQRCADINMQVVAPDGSAAGADTLPNNAPRVAFTAAASGQYTIQMTMVQCEGRYCSAGARVLSASR